MTPIFELDMEQGASWNATINWYGGDIFRAPIEELDPGYPTKVRVTGHGLPNVSDTPVIISGVQGVEMINSKDTGVEECEYIDEDYFYVPISSVGCEWVPGTGEITWHEPSDITEYTARCKLRKNWAHPTVIHEFTTEIPNITLIINDASIRLDCTAAETAAFTFATAYGDIELISNTGEVTRVARLKINLSRETTK